MEKAVRDGLVKNIGLSNTNSKMITDVWESATIKPSVVQVGFTIQTIPVFPHFPEKHNHDVYTPFQIEVQPFMSQAKLVDFIQSKGMAVTGYSNLGAVARSW
jgi:alcohol dehydrogenase (NADP+)